jgi:hypothetical protein
MESQQTGLLERLRAQRESMQSGSPAVAVAEAPALPETSSNNDDDDRARPMPERSAPSQPSPLIEEHAVRIGRLEGNHEDVRNRLDSIEANLRAGLNELRGDLPNMVTAEVTRHLTPTNEALADLGGRMGRMETDFSRERERWAGVVTSFDQRLDQRLRSFRQDVTVMLTGMAVLILAMLMLLLLRH